MTGATRFRQAALGWIYPPLCAGCETPLDSGRQIEMPFLCHECEETLVPIPEGYCQVCGQSYETSMISTAHCGNCGDRELAFDFAVSAYRSTGGAREIMHAYKYGRQLHLSRLMGHLMQRVWADTRLQETRSWLVVPVPLFSRRQRKRGFNQAHEIAREFIRSAPKDYQLHLAPLLRRNQHTVRQAQLDRKERLENLTGAFKIRKKHLPEPDENQGILIVDDVMTTGTTVSECAAVLREASEDSPTEWATLAGLSVLRG
ncbi:MAG: ComF family protein [Verrucomicrobiales bacterium]|nr:ComF family protein [Verrucomicrobiales bacterium]